MSEIPSVDDIAPLDLPNSANLDASGEPIKRRRGRPPGSKNKTYGGQPVGARAGSRRGSLEKEIGGMLVVINLPLQMVPALQRDALDQVELTALAKAIDQQCQTSPTFRKYVEQALKVQGGTSLFAVVAMIAARRVVRHDILPIEIPEEIGGAAGIDLLIGQAIAATNNMSVFKASVPNPEPVSVS